MHEGFNAGAGSQPGSPGEASAHHHESGLGRILHAVGHAVAEGASVLLTPYSQASEAGVAHATPDRRQGDKVNPYEVDISGFVNTNHRT